MRACQNQPVACDPPQVRGWQLITNESETAQPGAVDKDRRTILKGMAAISVALGVGASLPILKSVTPVELKIPKWPRVKIAKLSDLSSEQSKVFMYPLENTPNILLKLGSRVDGGVGPDGNIVAYSQVCQHLGCFVRFTPAGQSSGMADKNVFYCPCHGGYYDAATGIILAGPPLYPLPRTLLQYDETTGDIIAYGMGPPVIFGKGPPGSTEIWRDLMGGNLVSGE